MSDQELTILLLEDDDLDAEAVYRACRKHDFDARMERAADGAAGLELARDLVQRDDGPPFVIVLDLNMPGMNGHEFLELIRSDERLSPLPVFVLTTSSHERDVRLAYRHHVAGYFTKEHLADLIIALKSFRQGAIFPDVR
ncbi:MAG: response regulator [Planctomycetota bacterium]